MNVKANSTKTNRSIWMFVLVGLALLSLIFVLRGTGRMMSMQTHAASNAEFVQLKPQDETKIVVEITEASGGKLRGHLLEKQDETHYSRTSSAAEVNWNKDTKLVMGKTEDVHNGAVVHITGKVASDRSVQASQIVILTGYVQVK